MAAFLVSALIGIVIGAAGRVVAWVAVGVAVLVTAILAATLPMTNGTIIATSMLIGCLGYNLGLAAMVVIRFGPSRPLDEAPLIPPQAR